MDHDNRCVWVRLQQRSQLLTVLIRLEHPALVARKLPSQQAEYAPHIEVVRRLVVTEVVVPKFRNVCHPLPLIAGEVGNLQFVLAARVVRRLLVHDGEDGVLAQSLPSFVGPGPPRIGTLRVRAVRRDAAPAVRRDRPAGDADGDPLRAGSRDECSRSEGGR